MRSLLRRIVCAAVIAASAFAASAAYAHHSVAMFDLDKTVIVKGAMKSITYLNPHVWISVIGAPDGKGDAVQWDVEATSTIRLAEMGIQKDTLKPGDKITIVMHPLRDGRRGGSFMLLATADGKMYGASPADLKLKPQDLKP